VNNESTKFFKLMGESMTAITETFKAGLSGTVGFLNQPVVKEGIKNIAGTVTFTFGLVEAYDIYQILKGRPVTTENHKSDPKWLQVASKVAIVCSKISLILSAGTSRPGIFIISTLAGQVFSSSQLTSVFGPNKSFVLNPLHPRHVFSVAALLLVLPSAGLSLYRAVNEYLEGKAKAKVKAKADKNWLTDYRVRLMNLFTAVTSRPTLHIGNQVCRFILSKV
jgi:hypothetical protein